MTPGKNQKTFSRILREQSYLKGIDREHLRPWTVKKTDEPAGNPLPSAPAPSPVEEPVAPPTM